MHDMPNHRFWITVTLALAIAWGGPAAAGDWPYSQHDIGGTSRTGTSGAISGAELPGQLLSIEVDGLDLGDALLYEVGGDGIPDVVTALRGRVAAYAGSGAGLLWSTPLIQATDLVGIYDLDGDGVEDELVGASSDIAGGVFVVDHLTGGLLWNYGPLDLRSGVDAREVTAADLNGDGAVELIFAEQLYGNEYLHVADFSAGLANAEVIDTVLPGGYLNFNRSVAGDFFGVGYPSGLLVQQSSSMSLFETCSPADAGAACTPSEGLCLCDRGLFADVHPSFSWGPFWAQDVDGDGDEEVIEFQDSSRYGSQILLLDPAEGIASGAALAEDLVVWTYNYGYSQPETFLLVIEEEAQDLDGDGDPDLVVTIFNDVDGEVDFYGVAAEDGIHHPDAFAVAVFDAATGELVQSLPDAVAWGVDDFDGDGVPEIVTSPTTAWTYGDGVFAYTVECAPICTLMPAWGTPDHNLVLDIDTLDDANFPDPSLMRLDNDLDGFPELLAYDGQHLDMLDVDPGGDVSLLASILLDDDEDVFLMDDIGHALLYSGETTRMIGYDLDVLGLDVVPQGQRTPEVLAVQLDPADDRAALVVDGAVYWTAASPASPADADLQMLPHALLAEDLTGDGYPELVSFAQPDEMPDGRLAVETWSFDPTDPDGDGTPFGLLWAFDGAAVEALSGFALRDPRGHLTRLADVDGDGDSELLFALFAAATFGNSILALDGATGDFAHLLEVDFLDVNWRFANDVPVWVDDVVDTAGNEGADGRDDLFISDHRNVHLLPGGADVPVAAYTTSSSQWDGAYGDLDGDGEVELVTLYGSITAADIVAADISATPADLWDAPLDLDVLANYSRESLALVIKDSDPGLDVVYASASGSVEIREGDSGELAPGYPQYLSEGQMLQAEDLYAAAVLAVAVFDVDDDGYEELLLGGGDGFLYAMNVDEGEGVVPSLEWTFSLGTPIEAIRIADVDGDGLDEVIIAGPDSTVRALDNLGVSLEILTPPEGICLPTTEFSVTGTATGLEWVDVYIGGLLAVTDAAVVGGEWEADGVVAAGTGTWEVEAVGKDGFGNVLAFDSILVLVDGDDDGDGFTVCGGDCDDTNADLTLADEDGDGQSTCDGDCDDDDATLNGDDADGDGFTTCDGDCDDADVSATPEDLDGDGYSSCDGDCDDADEALTPDDLDGDGYSSCAGDCDEDDPNAYPDADEVCGDGIDQDCDGEDKDCDEPYQTDDDDDDGKNCDCDLGSRDPLAGAPSGALVTVLALLGYLRRRSR